MRISDKGIELIKKFEGFYPKSYLCPAKIWTIGYGHTKGIHKNSPDINEKQAEDFLKKDLQVCENDILRLINVELNQNEFDSLCSFVFNLGSGSLQRSTLRAKLNRCDYEGAADEFLKWNKSKGKTLKGLTLRREAERELFLS